MKLVVISHACITPQNQEFFQRVSDAAGWNVTIILPSQWKTDFKTEYVMEKLASFRGTIIPVPVYFKGKVPLHFYHFKIFKALRTERPDVIYVHNEPYALSTFQVMLYNFFRLRKTIGFYAAQNIRKNYPLLIRLMEQFSFKHADYCFPVTESAAHVLRDKGYAGKISVLPLGVTQSHIDSALPGPDALQRLNRPFIIGYVGRLVPEKGIDILLRALPLLHGSDWECKIIGEGKLKEDLLKLSHDLSIDGKIKFLGYVGHGDIACHVAEFSVLVLPSLTMPNWTEQFGRVVIEALAAGVPVIGTKSGEIPFLIRKLEGGIVVDEGDPKAIAQAIDSLMSDPVLRKTFAERGRENVKKYFLESKIAGDFVATVEEVMN